MLIVEDGKEYAPPADADLIANFQKPDGKFAYNAAKIDEGNRILVELTNQVLAVPGEVVCEVEIRAKDSSQVLTSCTFTVRNDPADGCLFSCNYKEDEWVELENIPVEDTHWQEALALAKKLGLESLPDEKKSPTGLFITDETLDSVCLIYKAPDDEIVYRYLDADGNTRSALRDFFEDLAGQLQTEGKRGDA